MVLTHLRDTLALVVVVGALATLLLGACGGEDAPEEVALATATPSETAASERASPSPEPEATQAVETAASETATSERASPSPEPEAPQAAATTPTPTSTPETTVEAEEARVVVVVDPDVQACSNGIAVPEPALNPGLVR